MAGSTKFNYEASLKASGTVSPSVFVTLDPNFDEQYVQSYTSDLPIGVMWEAMRLTPGLGGSDNTIAAQSGDVGPRVIQLGNEALIVCGGTVNCGNLLAPNTVGQAISAGSATNYGAVALQKGTSGQKIKCIVRPGLSK